MEKTKGEKYQGQEDIRRVWSNNLLNVRHFIVIYNVTRQRRAPTTSFTVPALGREIFNVGCLWKTHCGSKTRIRGGTSVRDKNPGRIYACENTCSNAVVITSFSFLSSMKERSGSYRFLSCEIALVRTAIRSRRLNPIFFTLRSLQITSKSSIVFVRNIPLKVTRDTSRKHSTAGETLIFFSRVTCRESWSRDD